MTKKKRAERKKQLIWGAVGVVAIILLAVVAGFSTELRTQVGSLPNSSVDPAGVPLSYRDLVSFVGKCSQQQYDAQNFDCQNFGSQLDAWCRQQGSECLTAGVTCLSVEDDWTPHSINYVKVSKDGEDMWCLVDVQAGYIDCDPSIDPGTPDKPDDAPPPATMSSICQLMTQNYGAKPINGDTCYCQQVGLVDYHNPPFTESSACAEFYDQRVASNGYNSSFTQEDVGRSCIKCCSTFGPYRQQDGKWLTDCVDSCHNTFPALNISPDVCAADKSLTSQLACHQCCDRQLSSPEKGSGQWLTECRLSCDQAHPLPTTGFHSPLQSTLNKIFP